MQGTKALRSRMGDLISASLAWRRERISCTMSENISGGDMKSSTSAFLQARDFLLRHREDYHTAYRDFEWPQLGEFNWALDHFDVQAQGNHAAALWVVEDDGSEEKLSFAQLSARSNQVANFLRQL